MIGAVARAGIGLQARAGLEPVDVGHHHVEEDEIRRDALGDGDGILAAARGQQPVALALERLIQDLKVRGVVVHEQDLRRRHGHVSSESTSALRPSKSNFVDQPVDALAEGGFGAAALHERRGELLDRADVAKRDRPAQLSADLGTPIEDGKVGTARQRRFAIADEARAERARAACRRAVRREPAWRGNRRSRRHGRVGGCCRARSP